jgi:hypothetical protein
VSDIVFEPLRLPPAGLRSFVSYIPCIFRRVLTMQSKVTCLQPEPVDATNADRLITPKNLATSAVELKICRHVGSTVQRLE